MQNPPRQLRQRAAALIMALFVISIVAVIATAILTREHYRTTRDVTLQNDQRMLWGTQAVEQWTAQILKGGSLLTKKQLSMNPRYFHGILMHAYNEDMQGRFNLNTLTKPDNQQAFLRLIMLQDSKIKKDQAQKLMMAVVSKVQQQKLVSVSELRLVTGMSADLYLKLAPYLSALPEDNTAINVNTASVPVIMMLAPDISLSAAKSVVTERTQQPFKSIADFQKLPAMQQYKLVLPATVNSSFFLLHTLASIGSQRLILLTLLQRTGNHDSVVVRPLWQTRGLS